MSLAGDVSVAVNMFTLVQKVGRPTAVKLEQRTNKPVKVESSSICDETGNILQDNQIAYSYTQYGGATNVVFDKVGALQLQSLWRIPTAAVSE